MWPCVISQNIVSSDDTVELAYMYTDNPARYKLKPRPFHLPCTLERTLLFFLLVFGLFFLKCSLTLPNTTPCSKHRSDVTQFQAFNTSFGWSASTIIIKLMFTPWKIKNLFSAKDAISKLSRFRVVYINLLAQAVVPVMLARQTDMLHVFVNIWHPIKTCTSFSTFLGQKHAELCAQRIASPRLCVFSTKNQGGLILQLGEPLIKQAS